MYIFVKKETNVIIGCSTNKVDELQMEKNGNIVYKILDNDFNYDMIGQKIEEFEEIDD